MMIDKPGSYRMTNEEYHKDSCVEPSLSRSTIKDFLYECPAKGWFNHPRLNPNFKADEGESKFDLGTAAHSLLLEGVDNVWVVEETDWRKKTAQEARELAKKEGKTALLKHQYARVFDMLIAAREQISSCKELGIKNLREDGDSELSYFWQEEDVWLKIRPDWISKDRKLILDYKTTDNSVNPDGLERHITNLGYDIQASLYSRGVKAIEGTSPKFIFVFQETSEPYFCSFVGLPPEFMALANSKVEFAIGLWRTCLAMNHWPAYPSRVAWIEPPPWALAAWERKAQEISL